MNGMVDGCKAPALSISIERAADGRSRIADRRVSFPWSLGRGFPGPPDQPVAVIPQAAGAGLLSGDCVRQQIRVGPGAALDLRSAGAMLTYGSPDGPPTTSHWTIELQQHACARIFSEPYVLLEDADFTVRQTIVMDPEATLVSCEGIVCASSTTNIRWETETIVRRPEGKVLFTDRLRAGPETLRRHHSLATSWSAFGTVIILTPRIRPAVAALERTSQALEGTAWLAIAPTVDNSGVSARIAAEDGQRLRMAMQELVRAATAF